MQKIESQNKRGEAVIAMEKLWREYNTRNANNKKYPKWNALAGNGEEGEKQRKLNVFISFHSKILIFQVFAPFTQCCRGASMRTTVQERWQRHPAKYISLHSREGESEKSAKNRRHIFIISSIKFMQTLTYFPNSIQRDVTRGTEKNPLVSCTSAFVVWITVMRFQ